MSFDLAFAIAIAPDILKAAITTVWITIASSALAIAAGFLLALLLRPGRLVGGATTVAVDFLRITPILAQLYFLYFVLPFWSIRLPAVAVGILGLGLHYAGYLAEVFRAGIGAIPPGQREGGAALGMRRWQVVLLIVAPQVARAVAPPVANYVLAILKSTPYLAVLAVPEMLGVALDHASDSFRYVEPMAVVGILFFLFCLAAARLVHLLHRGDAAARG